MPATLEPSDAHADATIAGTLGRSAPKIENWRPPTKKANDDVVAQPLMSVL